MKQLFITLVFIATTPFLFAQKTEQIVKYSEAAEQIKPTLFADLGVSCSTPDGMAISRKGRLFLAVTNLTTFEKYGSKILTFDKKNQPSTWFDSLPLHPISKRVHPMGMEFGKDGHLYIADNQTFADQQNQSRILRVLVRKGKPVKAEVVVEGLSFANGLRIYKNRIYVTDFISANGKESGIYSFSIDQINTGKIQLNETTKSKYLLSTFPPGIDGIAIDKLGNLYAGNFMSGTITKIELNKDGTLKSKRIIFDSDKLNCADGMFYDKKKNSVFIANLSNNSVHQLDLKTNIIHLIWVNGDSDGANGLLDNPCETIMYKGDLIVVNFDTFKGMKNSEVDSLNTISKFSFRK